MNHGGRSKAPLVEADPSLGGFDRIAVCPRWREQNVEASLRRTAEIARPGGATSETSSYGAREVASGQVEIGHPLCD